MGGGDLNSKKSWHPHTLKNQEQVWKAEQAKALEEKKLNDLRKEIQEERDLEDLKRVGRESGVLGGSHEGDKKLDWMYKNSHDLINRDEYLLGRKVDKSFEVLQAEEQHKDKNNLVGVKQPLNHVEHECVPFSIRAYKNLQITEQVDLQRKFMEDPLMLIKQREMESRRKILENPVKLKELHRILKTDEKLKKDTKKSKKSKKSRKSKKKHKKRSKSSSTSSSSSEMESNDESDSDLDSKLAKKLKVGIFDEEDILQKGMNLNKLLDSKYEKISQELDKAAGKSKKRSKKKKTRKDSSESRSDNSDLEYKKRSGQRSRSQSRQNSRNGNVSKSVSRNTNNRMYKVSSKSPMKTVQRSDGKYEQQRNRHHYRSRSRSNSISRKMKTSMRESSRSSEHKQYKSKSPITKRVSTSRSVSKRRNKSRSPVCPSDKRPHNRNVYERRSRSNSRSRRRSSKSRSRSHNRNKLSRKSPSRSLSPRTSVNSYKKTKPSSTTVTNSHQRPGRLTDEEKQARLREMMSNAEWREEERSQTVRKHREDYAREEERHSGREFDKDFLNKEVKKAMASQTSVGSRLKANLNNIQRTSAAMNANFVKK